MRIAEAGSPTDPLLILAHGWPESWYSWRHQIPVLAAAGYHVVAPDMRGYGGSDAPREVAAYDILHLVSDMAGVAEAMGSEHCVIVGHDWGALVAWHAALLEPQRFRAVVAMSVPYFGRPPAPPTEIWKKRHGDHFYYILYHQEPGIAEAEYDADPVGLLRMLYTSPDTPRYPATITDPHRSAGGWIGRWGEPRELPHWLEPEDLEYFVGQFSRSGFRGGLNYYRNFDRNWKLLEGTEEVIRSPALFIAGSGDPVIAGLSRAAIEQRMRPFVPNLKQTLWLEGAGHWIQQERPEACSRAIIDFLKSLD